MPNDRWSWLILGALALSLVLNGVALMRIGDLREEVEQFRNQPIHGSTLQSDISSINQQINQLSEEQKWVSDIDWTIDPHDGNEDCQGDVPVAGTISFREIGRDASVSVEFRETNADEWQRVDANLLDDVDYHVSTELSLDATWEYRILAESEQSQRTSDPEPLDALHLLTDQAVFFEQGESRQQDGERWARLVIDNHSPHVSPCNEIVGATIEMVDGDDARDVIEMQPEYPGEYDPEGYEEPEEQPDGVEADESIYGASPEGSGDRTVWWTDWVEFGAEVTPVATIEFGDGTTMTVDRMGPHEPNR